MDNLDNFPTNETAQDMLSMVSPIYENSYVGKWIFQVMGENTEEAKQVILNLPEELFPETASWTLPYWEGAYGLEEGSGEDYEERRLNVLNKRNNHYPMNPERMALILKKRYGREFEIVEQEKAYTFLVKIQHGDTQLDYEKLYQHVDELKQSHMGYSAELDLTAKTLVMSGFAVKEYKKIGNSEFTPSDPLAGIICYADESGDMLTDEKSDILII